MKKILFLLIIASTSSASAQTNDSTFTKKKHTLGIAGLPLHVLFLSEATNRQKYNLSYKRQGNKLHFRSSINYSYYRTDIFHRGTVYETIVTSNDSTWLKRTNNDSETNDLDLRIGLEKNWQKKRSTFILGLDLISGIYQSDTNYSETYFPEGTNLEIPQIDLFLSNSNFTMRSTTKVGFGVSPVIGWEYSISSKFGTSIQYRPTFVYQVPLTSSETKRDRFDDGVLLEDVRISNPVVDLPANRLRRNSHGLDLFLTYKF